MKIKLPERRYFTPGDLAKRWEVEISDVEHLIETSQLQAQSKFAARGGYERTVFVIKGYKETDDLTSDIEFEEIYPAREVVLVLPIGEDKLRSMKVKEVNAMLKENFGDDIEQVVLLEEVLRFEAQCSEQDRNEHGSSGIRENTLLATIAALKALWPKGDVPSAKELEKAASSIGIRISDDSIRNAMKRADDITER